jgi:hypothetical protein
VQRDLSIVVWFLAVMVVLRKVSFWLSATLFPGMAGLWVSLVWLIASIICTVITAERLHRLYLGIGAILVFWIVDTVEDFLISEAGLLGAIKAAGFFAACQMAVLVLAWLYHHLGQDTPPVRAGDRG